MMDERAVPPALLNPTEDIRPFTLSSPVEIVFQLRSLINRREMVSVYFNHGEEMLLTTLIDVDAARGEFSFDLGSDENVNARLLRCERAVFVAAPDGVKTQFVCGPFRASTDSRGRTITCRLPPDVVKLQRREYFRVETPIAHPLVCQVHEPQPLKLPLHDISVGGLSLVRGAHTPVLERMTLLVDCRIALPGFGALIFDLEVRNLRTLLNRNGSQIELIGCRFVNLPGKAESVLQRYMIQLERERRNLAG